MIVEGVNEPVKTEYENLGEFKLKDKEGRNAVRIDLSTAKRPITDALYLWVMKMPTENNKVKILIEWKPISVQDTAQKTLTNENPSK